MYYVSFIFGLGFDTSIEIILLGIASIQIGSKVPIWIVIFLYLAFTAGLCLSVTMDRILMLGINGLATILCRNYYII